MKNTKQNKLLTIIFFAITFLSFVIFVVVNNNIVSTLCVILLLKSLIAGITFLIKFIIAQRTKLTSNEEPTYNSKFFHQSNFIICMLIFIPIIGIILMWTQNKFKKSINVILTIIFIFVFVFDIVSFSTITDEDANFRNSPIENTSQSQTTTKELSTIESTTTNPTTNITTENKTTITKETITTTTENKTTTTKKATTATTTAKKETTTKQKSGVTVYITPTGKKYHYSKKCAGKNAIEKDLDDVDNLYGPCGNCVN